MFRIVYEKHESGNFHVRLPDLLQIISVRPCVLKRIIGASERSTIGCSDVTVEQLCDLGFIVPSIWMKKTV